jgi:hypothetical protein
VEGERRLHDEVKLEQLQEGIEHPNAYRPNILTILASTITVGLCDVQQGWSLSRLHAYVRHS